MRSKGQISLNFGYHINFNFQYQTLCVFSQIKDRKHIEQNFLFCCQAHAPGVGLAGAEGVKNFSVGICDCAPSTACSSLKLGPTPGPVEFLKKSIWTIKVGKT